MTDRIETFELGAEELEVVAGGSRYALVGHRTDEEPAEGSGG
ncbi:MAG TPA: hypothetical protein VNT25_01970 [Allosphingosinicella sp.]|nr:hypothetical protein [Allosphingosinicella sp.]